MNNLRWKDINIILFLSKRSRCKLDLGLTSDLCQTIQDELFFYKRLQQFAKFYLTIFEFCQLLKDILSKKKLISNHLA
jgi:hypothetical protein